MRSIWLTITFHWFGSYWYLIVSNTNLRENLTSTSHVSAKANINRYQEPTGGTIHCVSMYITVVALSPYTYFTLYSLLKQHSVITLSRAVVL